MPADPNLDGGLDVSAPGHFHVVNVGGAGMSAIATLLVQMGHRVTGIDDKETPFLPPLRELGVEVIVGPSTSAAVIADARAVVVSTATPGGHLDLDAARAAQVPVLHRSDALAAICATRQVVAVAGTHGKSTTSAMLATIVDGVGTGDGFLVGTRVTGLGTNARWGTGSALVVEADESDGTFLRLGATHAVVTNLEPDHLSYWGSEEALVSAFERFVGAVDGSAVVCIDDPGAQQLVRRARHPVTYGTDPAADLRIVDVAAEGIGVAFGLVVGADRHQVQVPCAPGVHNARNAAAALAAAAAMGIELPAAIAALAAFAGVARRFELRGEVSGITFIDSYDHLPTEVAAALAAARGGPFDRVVCVFQPHRFTRTRDLAHTFADAFVDADVLVVTDLYSAGETPIPGITGRLVADAVSGAHPEAPVEYVAGVDAAVSWMVDNLRAGDVCITLNAGDLTTAPDRAIAALTSP